MFVQYLHVWVLFRLAPTTRGRHRQDFFGFLPTLYLYYLASNQ